MDKGTSHAPSISVPIHEDQCTLTSARSAEDLAHVEKLFERLGFGWLVKSMPPRALWAAYVFVNGFLSIALLALLAVVTGVPFVFPSLGPTAYQLFFLPRAPRNA